jgi:hypothetical protein
MFVVIDDAMVRSSLPYDTLFHNVVDLPGVKCACTTTASREAGSNLLPHPPFPYKPRLVFRSFLSFLFRLCLCFSIHVSSMAA